MSFAKWLPGRNLWKPWAYRIGHRACDVLFPLGFYERFYVAFLRYPPLAVLAGFLQSHLGMSVHSAVLPGGDGEAQVLGCPSSSVRALGGSLSRQ